MVDKNEVNPEDPIIYLLGNDVDYFFTLKSMYDQDSIGVKIGDEHYRLKVSELNKIVNSLIFKLLPKPDKRYRLNWLEIDDYWLDRLLKHGETALDKCQLYAESFK